MVTLMKGGKALALPMRKNMVSQATIDKPAALPKVANLAQEGDMGLRGDSARACCLSMLASRRSSSISTK